MPLRAYGIQDCGYVARAAGRSASYVVLHGMELAGEKNLIPLYSVGCLRKSQPLGRFSVTLLFSLLTPELRRSLQVFLHQFPQLVTVVALHVNKLHAVAIRPGIANYSREMDLSKS